MLELASGKTHSIKKENPKSKTTVLFIHGNSHSISTFKNLFETKELDHYSLFAYDLFGHGKSENKPKYNLELYTNQLIEFISKLSGKNIYLVGHSLGGHIILQSLDVLSSKVKGVLCFGTPPLDFTGDSPFLPSECMQYLLQENITQNQAEKIFNAFHNRMPTQKDTEAIKDLIQTDREFRLQFFQDVFKGHFKDEAKQIKSTRLPIEFHFGDKDSLTNFEYFKQRSLNIIVHKQQCHNFHYENPKLLAASIRDFIASNS